MYREDEDSIFTHDGKQYSLNKVFELTENLPIQKVLVKDLQWVLKYTEVDENRVELADLNTPILIAHDKQKRPTVVDGAHRLTKAVRLKIKTLPAIWISNSKLKKCLV